MQTDPLISINRELGALNERTLATQKAVEKLTEAFEAHRVITEAKAAKVSEGVGFLRGEWRMVVMLAGLVIEHFWPKGIH
jgi:hypothetical protein